MKRKIEHYECWKLVDENNKCEIFDSKKKAKIRWIELEMKENEIEICKHFKEGYCKLGDWKIMQDCKYWYKGECDTPLHGHVPKVKKG